MPLAVCLTGQLRWAGLALGMLRQFVLRPHAEPHNLFYVGPADDDYTAARPLLRTLLGLPRKRRCVYDPHVSWEWPAGAGANASAPEGFELHGSDLCTRSREQAERPRLIFNLRALPIFRQCHMAARRVDLPAPRGFDASKHDRFDRLRARPCAQALSLVLQLWQCAQCMDLVRVSEAGTAGAATTPYHDAVLRLRADLFHFAPVSLPALPDRREPWYASMEPTCLVGRSALQADWVPCRDVRKSLCTKKDKVAEVRPQQLQDLWLYGTRPAMERVLPAPLQAVLESGRRSSLHWRKLPAGKKARPWFVPPLYRLQPWPHAMNRTIGARHCIPLSGVGPGLLRVNPAEGCFVVHARIPRCLSGNRKSRCNPVLTGTFGLKWFSIAPTTPPPVLRNAAPLLRAIAAVFRECFGLHDNATCAHVAGDTLLPRSVANREDACLSAQPLAAFATDRAIGNNATDACSRRSVWPWASSDPSRLLRSGLCVDAGLGRLVNASYR